MKAVVIGQVLRLLSMVPLICSIFASEVKGVEAGEIRPPRGGRGHQMEWLHVEIDRSGRRPFLIVTLRNTTTSVIRVDRELVFLVEIVPVDKDAVEIPCEAISPPVRKLDSASARSRVIPLKPGESISRRVDLYGGFKTFAVGTAFGGKAHLAVSASEGRVQLPDDVRPARVIVRYGKYSSSFDRAFKEYTGATIDDLGLFDTAFSEEAD